VYDNVTEVSLQSIKAVDPNTKLKSLALLFFAYIHVTSLTGHYSSLGLVTNLTDESEPMYLVLTKRVSFLRKSNI